MPMDWAWHLEGGGLVCRCLRVEMWEDACPLQLSQLCSAATLLKLMDATGLLLKTSRTSSLLTGTLVYLYSGPSKIKTFSERVNDSLLYRMSLSRIDFSTTTVMTKTATVTQSAETPSSQATTPRGTKKAIVTMKTQKAFSRHNVIKAARWYGKKKSSHVKNRVQ